MTLETLFIFIMSLTLLWIKPGPGQAFIITRALNDGFWPAFYVVLGITSGVTLFFLIAVLGLNVVTQFFDKAGFLFKLAGAAYLLHMGYIGLKNIESGTWTGRTDQLKRKKFLENFPAALLLTLGNPFVIFYFIGIMPTLIPVATMTTSDIIFSTAIVITVGLIVDTLIIILISQVKQMLSDSNLVKKLNLVTSISFLAIGFFLLYSALFMGNFSYEMI